MRTIMVSWNGFTGWFIQDNTNSPLNSVTSFRISITDRTTESELSYRKKELSLLEDIFLIMCTIIFRKLLEECIA
jgi:hypothetical protein